MSREGFFAGRIEERSIEVEISSDLPLHIGADERALHETNPQFSFIGLIFRRLIANQTVHAATSTMVLPPREGGTKMSCDEETYFSWSKAVVAHPLIVVQISDDGLGRTAWIR